jgi:hypothetical protein
MNTKLRLHYVVLSIGAFAVFSFCNSSELAPRESYSTGLPKIATAINDTTAKCNRVRITFDRSDDYVLISEFDDVYAKSTRNGFEKTVFRESMEKSYQLTSFETMQIDKVCDELVRSLEEFEKNLQNERWGKCLFLDAYLPNFLSGFYYLILVARNNSEDVPIEAKIDELMFDVSLNSIKSDERVRTWCSSVEYIVSLRIAAKELVYQTKVWQKKELANQKRDLELPQDSDFFKSLIFFERIYFNKSKLTH